MSSSLDFSCLLLNEHNTGHARNLLIPRKIAVYATLENKELYADIIKTEYVGQIVKKHEKLQELSKEPLIMERLLDPGMNNY